MRVGRLTSANTRGNLVEGLNVALIHVNEVVAVNYQSSGLVAAWPVRGRVRSATRRRCTARVRLYHALFLWLYSTNTDSLSLYNILTIVSPIRPLTTGARIVYNLVH